MSPDWFAVKVPLPDILVPPETVNVPSLITASELAVPVTWPFPSIVKSWIKVLPELFTELAPVTSWSICIVLPPVPNTFRASPLSKVKVSFALSTVTLIEPLSVAKFLNTLSAFNAMKK